MNELPLKFISPQPGWMVHTQQQHSTFPSIPIPNLSAMLTNTTLGGMPHWLWAWTMLNWLAPPILQDPVKIEQIQTRVNLILKIFHQVILHHQVTSEEAKNIEETVHQRLCGPLAQATELQAILKMLLCSHEQESPSVRKALWAETTKIEHEFLQALLFSSSSPSLDNFSLFSSLDLLGIDSTTQNKINMQALYTLFFESNI